MPMLADNIFLKVISKEIPAKVVYEDDRCLAFHDIGPKAPVHVLVIPKAHHTDIAALAAADPALAGELLAAVSAVADAEGLLTGGFRVIFNTGPDGGQEVFHVHAHLLGGRPLGPMLGA